MTDESLFKIENLKALTDHPAVPADAKFVGIKIISFCDNKTQPFLRIFYVDKDGNDHDGTDSITGCPYPPHCRLFFTKQEDIIDCFQQQLDKFKML